MNGSSIVVLFTDFGLQGPYCGQMEAEVLKWHPSANVINLFANAPSFNSRASAHLLSAYTKGFPKGTVFLSVIDPGVGSRQRDPIVVFADDYVFVGPGNGLFDVVASRSDRVAAYKIVWQPSNLSNTFHGRDLFAPVAAKLAAGNLEDGWLAPIECASLQVSDDDLFEVIYVDDYGNAITGVRENNIALIDAKYAQIHGHLLSKQRTFADVPESQGFWYINSSGLVEIAVNKGSAADIFSLEVGDKIGFQ